MSAIMVRHADALVRRERRTALRRNQVLDAAETCFLAEGFHGASISRIAAKATMSAGHIYQYFEGKEAIIIALCERRFEGFENLLAAAEASDRTDTEAYLDEWVSQFAWWIDPSRAPLTIEIMAEAGRNPKVAEVVTRIDRHFREIMRRSLLPLAGPLSEREADLRLEAIVMLSHGMTSRITADKSADPRELLAAFRLAVGELVTAA